MADNTQLPIPQTLGDVIAADDIAGVKYQRVKLIHGADGVNDGDVSATNPLPTVIDGVATEATLDAINGYFKAEDTAATSGDKGLVMLAQRFAADTPTTDTDGDYTLLKVDEEGRLKVAAKPASYADITGDITAIQATIGTPVAGGTVSGDVSRASNVMMFCTGTFSTVNCTFEGSLEASGDTNWFGIQAVRSNANTIETATGNLSAAPAYAWELSVNGLKRVRVRCTARTSGTQSWRFVLGTYATEPIPAAQVSASQPVTLTSTTITSHTPTTYNDTTTNLTGGATFTGTSRDAGATNTMRRFCAAVAADQSGTLFIQCSNDNTTWRTIKSLTLTAPNAFGELEVNVCTRYHRVLFVNGAVAQTAFILNSSYHRV